METSRFQRSPVPSRADTRRPGLRFREGVNPTASSPTGQSTGGDFACKHMHSQDNQQPRDRHLSVEDLSFADSFSKRHLPGGPPGSGTSFAAKSPQQRQQTPQGRGSSPPVDAVRSFVTVLQEVHQSVQDAENVVRRNPQDTDSILHQCMGLLRGLADVASQLSGHRHPASFVFYLLPPSLSSFFLPASLIITVTLYVWAWRWVLW